MRPYILNIDIFASTRNQAKRGVSATIIDTSEH